ncbi:type II toxin-antitoxin system RelB/DinJ family antitoxin [Intestinimonas massiliensis]|uniref:Type II toxin-antitoxin system RelB/DinJ family antitoxin n=1 Tax=Intestinimonas massiliensis (ex Afouda et al. 2020) TaxID=1673721 RepID=A0AAW5JKH3_9FIRM|nr:type II toxin-antitoxin system RelB/DinJ family antitoxin [Intestinimonas massiliensis (ex Afouda et al. 2020)]MCQ4770342.1 type II toxin-antitoxin system RelB/DinJ family antitoxin [Intestinimonas massiliensis (ex Afouda et al. 2020)]
MEMVTIEVSLPKEIYDKVSEILAKEGLTLEDALNLFFQETIRLGRIPFEYTEDDLEEVRRWEKMMNDDLCDV